MISNRLQNINNTLPDGCYDNQILEVFEKYNGSISFSTLTFLLEIEKSRLSKRIDHLVKRGILKCSSKKTVPFYRLVVRNNE